jgi:hypothetical protein
MKRFFKKFSILLLILLIGYVLFSSIEKISNGTVGVVEDLRSKKVVRMVRPGPGGYSFVWRASIPWRYSFAETPLERDVRYEIRISIPDMENLKEEYYHIRIPLNVGYRIDPQKFSDIAALGREGRPLDDLVKRFFTSVIEKELMAYLYPVYQREAIAARMNIVMETTKGDIDQDLRSHGLVLVRAALSGAVSLPGRTLYYEGMQYAADLRRKDRSAELGLIDVRGRVERQKIENRQFYSKLREISSIIADNPEILKYIYIDKMGGNVKVILSSDASGVPAMLNGTAKPKKGAPVEIDNLSKQ